MVRRATVAVAAIALIAPVLAACAEPPACAGGVVTQRNPTNLACVLRQLPSPDCPDIPPPPPWPICKHPCEEIRDEAACAATAGCRVARHLCDVFDDRCARLGPFIGCFPVGLDTAAPGACADLTATACATREDCGAQYLQGPECPELPDPEEPAVAPPPPPDGPRCVFSFVTCFDERTPP